jgi:hypothetical protein
LPVIDVGTHLLIVGEVLDGDVTNSWHPPLTYAYYRDVKKGKAPKNAPTYLAPTKTEEANNAPLPSGKYVCATCGDVYDPAVGDPVRGFARKLGLPGLWCRQIGFRQTIVTLTINHQIAHEESSDRSKIPRGSKGGKRNLLVVRLRAIQETALLRRFPQRN